MSISVWLVSVFQCHSVTSWHREKPVCFGVSCVVPTRFPRSGSEVGRRAAFPSVIPLASGIPLEATTGSGSVAKYWVPVFPFPVRLTQWFLGPSTVAHARGISALSPIFGGGHPEVSIAPPAGVSITDRGGGRPERQLPRSRGPPGGPPIGGEVGEGHTAGRPDKKGGGGF